MKRIWLTAAAVVLALSVLTGCSGTGELPDSQPASRPNGGTSSSSSATGSNASSSGSSSSSSNSSSASSKDNGASSASSSTAASSKPEETTPWKYQKSGSSITITGYDGALAGDVTIPSKIGDYTVTAIGNNAFDGNEKITSVTLPGTVKEIRQYAFRGCKNLKKITLQEGVESIGYYAFAGCTNLTEVNLPTTLNYIENLAFRSCVNLEQIVIPENAKGQETKIQHCAFEFCSKLKKVYFPKTLKTLYDPFTGDTSVDYIYYGGTKEDWAKINITDGSINSTTVILYAQKPADINTTPTVPEEPDDYGNVEDGTTDELTYEFRQRALKAFNVRRTKAGVQLLRMNNKTLNEVAQRCAKDGSLDPFEELQKEKILTCGKATVHGDFAFRALGNMEEDDWYPKMVLNPQYKTMGAGMWNGTWCIILIG